MQNKQEYRNNADDENKDFFEDTLPNNQQAEIEPLESWEM